MAWPQRSDWTATRRSDANSREQTKNRRTDEDRAKDRIPIIHPEEDIYPLYLRALSCDETKDDCDTPQDVLCDTNFGQLSTERPGSELQALGLPLHHQDETLTTLFPGGDALLKTNVEEVTPKLDLPCMTLKDTLCYIRIVGNQLHRFGVRR